MSSKPRFVGEKVRVSDAFDLRMGKTPSRKNPAYWRDGGHDWVSIADLGSFGKYVGVTKERINDLAISESGIKPAPANTVLMSFKLSLGKTSITTEPVYTNEAIMAFVDKGVYPVDASFMYHQCRAKDWTAGTNTAVMGKTLNKKTLGQAYVHLPALEVQKMIAARLDFIDEQIRASKSSADKLEHLVKSRFVEMFEESDRYNGSVYRLADIGEIASGITKGRKARDKELFETPYLSTANVQAGRLDLSVIKTIDATMPEIEKFRLAEGDVLMTEGGDPDKVGRGAVAHNLPKNCIHQNHVFRVRLNRVILYPEYFEMFLQSPGCREYFFRASKQTTGIATINKTQLRNMQVLVPPIKAQEEFLAFASQVDKSRFIAQQQIEKLQMLYDSLAQDYFGD